MSVRTAPPPRHLARLGWVLIVGGALACSEQTPAREGRGVLVLAIDGLRADHVGSYGYDRDTTPSIDQLARSAITFEHAYSTAPWGLPAHLSLLSGCDPNVARRLLPEDVPETLLTVWHLPRAAPHIAEQFLRRGYRTAGIFEHPRMTKVHGLDHGFEVFEEGRGRDGGAASVIRSFQSWLRGLDHEQNWFAYLQVEDLGRIWHSVDLKWDTYFPVRSELDWVPPIAMADHTFFAIPREHWTGGLETLGEYEAEYDGAIRRIDTELGRLFKRLVRDGRFQRTTIVVVGTHGMGFGEAGLFLDHGTLSTVDLHVPLIIRPAERGLPGAARWARGGRVASVASTIDVAATLLDLAGLGAADDMQGVSLSALCRNSRAAAPRRFAFASCGHQEGYAVMSERWTFEARLPWTERRGLSRSWYGDEESHVDDYCERLQERDRPFDLSCGPILDHPVARTARQAGREAFDQTHRLRLRLQESGWRIAAEEVAMRPNLSLWRPGRFQ